MIEKIKKEIELRKAEIISRRRDFHRHPEVAFREERTAKVIHDYLQELGIPVSLGMNLFLIRAKKEYSPEYLYSFLRNHEEYVKSFSSGTGTKTITKNAVRSLLIGLPTSTEQQKIGVAIFSIEQRI